jgi:hypothetical protein
MLSRLMQSRNELCHASAKNRDVTLEAAPLLPDDAEATFSRGRVVPVPRKAVSDQGTLSTTGFQQIQTGLEVKIGVREFGGDTARAKLEVSDSTILEMVEGAPVVEREALASDLVIRSGGVYLVGSLRRSEHRRRRGLSDVLGLHDESSERTAQVWLRVFRIAGPTGEARVHPLRYLIQSERVSRYRYQRGPKSRKRQAMEASANTAANSHAEFLIA